MIYAKKYLEIYLHF